MEEKPRHYLKILRGTSCVTDVWNELEIETDEDLVVCIHRRRSKHPYMDQEPILVLMDGRRTGKATFWHSRWSLLDFVFSDGGKLDDNPELTERLEDLNTACEEEPDYRAYYRRIQHAILECLDLGLEWVKRPARRGRWHD